MLNRQKYVFKNSDGFQIKIMVDASQISIIDSTGTCKGNIEYKMTDKEVILKNVFVSPKRMGLGNLLMFFLSSRAIELGYKTIRTVNTSPIAFDAYKAMGFNEDPTQEKFLISYLDEKTKEKKEISSTAEWIQKPADFIEKYKAKGQPWVYSGRDFTDYGLSILEVLSLDKMFSKDIKEAKNHLFFLFKDLKKLFSDELHGGKEKDVSFSSYFIMLYKISKEYPYDLKIIQKNLLEIKKISYKDPPDEFYTGLLELESIFHMISTEEKMSSSNILEEKS
ncbi:MAG: GNAT family N-acetyltransferase, partial [Verrucomicrobia bacterium]|nr:GNAT family N-acetyltransferase [Verrucomicrobiota bacterium]